MGLEFVRDNILIRVDGDALDVWTHQYFSRFPLAWLVVRAQALKKDRLLLHIGLNNVDQALYAATNKQPAAYQILTIGIDAEEEREYRAFFAQVAQLCGRTVAAADQS